MDSAARVHDVGSCWCGSTHSLEDVRDRHHRLGEAPAAAPAHRRVRMELSDGHMDVCLSPDASPETVAALRAVGEAALAQPVGECLVCGHRLPLAIWREENRGYGVCDACRSLAEPNRGQCSTERGCCCVRV